MINRFLLVGALVSALAGAGVGLFLALGEGAAGGGWVWLIVILPLLSVVFAVLYALSMRRGLERFVQHLQALNDNSKSFSCALPESHWPFERMGMAFADVCSTVAWLLCIGKGYLKMLDAVPDPVFAADEDFKILHANNEVARLTGVDVRKIKGMDCRELFNAEVYATLEQARDLHESFEGEVIAMEAAGVQRFIKPVGDVLYDCHGDMIGYLVVAKDVTDLVRKEAEIKEKLDHLVLVGGRINEASAELSGSAGELASQVQQVQGGSEQQNTRVLETSTAMEEMNASVLDVARNAGNAAENAEASRNKAQEGTDMVLTMVKSIGDLRTGIDGLSTSMGELGQRAEGIGNIIDVISDIADQTNLLALNAAIEAARAGEAGRGFAVVADEVRKLAEKTMTATHEVEQAVADIQNGTRENVGRTRSAAEEAERITELASVSREYLTQIVELAETTAEQVRSIATAAEEQSASSEEISLAMDDVQRISGETNAGMAQAAEAVSELTALAGRLKELADQGI
ncbi:methyl-accepting chemotaxis protein [Desulfovibrio ferrophilus]|uniref:Methyl-accepting chemotaxis sensory transducer with Pas/Pac sensor n=1 Tax=Desulfovibrio ferrophilus TaxID=241368 RepID=A0A2Z6AU50_9BACT|nr:methyl-accepting chemotaxis protein [Desulfovibrio ferrophilus]BBD06749.1 methyl-accepting chemotaxis sensory transducer with Pas/Pac sensor [Desulfovibrio ferrophilus]